MTAVAVPTGRYRTGVVRECKLATVLEQHGCRTALLAHGKAVSPTLLAWRGKVPLPHWQVRWPDGVLSWLVTSFKSTCGSMRELGDLRTTGIDRPDYREYSEVERLTGKPVRVVFVHQTQNLVVVAGLHEHLIRSRGGGGGMVFWAFDQLPRLFSRAEVEAAAARAQRLDEPLFLPPDLPPMQGDLFAGLA